MADNRNRHLRIAPDTEEKSAADVAEMKKMIREHRLKILKIIGIVILAAALVISMIYYYFTHKEYSEYSILSESQRTDSSSAQFMEFNGNILRYSNDGAFYTDASNNLIWNQTYEFQNPVVDTCGEYVAIAEQGGTEVYILDTTELKGKISTTYPIRKVEVAGQGTIAVLMETDGTNYLQLYDKSGKNLAEGELHIENSGSALDIALSEDGKKMGISMLDVNEGTVKTTIAFYNFDSVGQNEIDNIVASYSYADTIVPNIEFVTNNMMAAFGDDKVIVFEGTQKPEEKNTIEVKHEIKSIFYSAEYFGLIYSSTDVEKPNKHKLQVFDYSGKEHLAMNFTLEYTQAEFLNNGEICIHSADACRIYTMSGIKKYTGTFDATLYKVISVNSWTDYLFILDEKTEKVRLK